jgi:hypothetical protein
LESEILIEKPKLTSSEQISETKCYFDILGKVAHNADVEVKEKMQTNGTY